MYNSFRSVSMLISLCITIPSQPIIPRHVKHTGHTHLTSCTLDAMSMKPSPVLWQPTSSRLNSVTVKSFHADISNFVSVLNRGSSWILESLLYLLLYLHKVKFHLCIGIWLEIDFNSPVSIFIFCFVLLVRGSDLKASCWSYSQGPSSCIGFKSKEKKKRI